MNFAMIRSKPSQAGIWRLHCGWLVFTDRFLVITFVIKCFCYVTTSELTRFRCTRDITRQRRPNFQPMKNKPPVRVRGAQAPRAVCEHFGTSAAHTSKKRWFGKCLRTFWLRNSRQLFISSVLLIVIWCQNICHQHTTIWSQSDYCGFFYDFLNTHAQFCQIFQKEFSNTELIEHKKFSN